MSATLSGRKAARAAVARRTRPSSRSQRGAAALVVTLLLFLAMALGALALKRSLGDEQHHAANQARAAQAFEAAEAGLAWAQAQLNSTAAIDAACRPSADPAARSFRDRVLDLDALTGAIAVNALPVTCVHAASGWSCGCGGAPAAPPASSDENTPSFTLSLLPADQPGLVRVAAQGCTRPGTDCATGTPSNADAALAASVTLALFPGLRTPPMIALTARDAMHQTDDQFFAGFFGVDMATWRDQVVVARVTCSTDCGAAVSAALAAGPALVAVDGDLHVAGPLTLGSATRPVVIVVRGALRLDGPVSVTGLLYAASVLVGAPGARVQGAVITEGGYAGPSAPDFRYDAGVLAALTHRTGSFARVGGSWRDF